MTSIVWGAISANTLFQIPDYDDPAISGSIIRTEIRPTEQKLRTQNRNWTNTTEITKLEPKLNQQNWN